MEFINDYMIAGVVIICLAVGFIIKHLIPSDAINKYIPLIVGVLGVFINTWLNDFAFTADILAGGLVSGLASTGLHQVFKQFINSGFANHIKSLINISSVEE